MAETLLARRLTVAVAESCTAGLLGHTLTSLGGSSGYFLGGIIAYHNDVKTKELGVPREVLDAAGAVSAETARLMACRIRERFGASVGLATTGIAGPTGGTPGKPVGLVFTALSHAGGCAVREHRFAGARDRIKGLSSTAALSMLTEFLDSEGVNDG